MKAFDLIKSCILCGHRCEIDRTKGQTGICKATEKMIIASNTPHYGEEPFISGDNGSGTIFFSHCNLRCVFCQNYEISSEGLGKETSKEDLANIMIALQEKGCHNINLVTPTHYMPMILTSIKIAQEKGLTIPIVYNTNGYDSIELLKLLDGIVDIYMPDMKYMDSKLAEQYSNAPNYPDTAKIAIKEMFRQVGNLRYDNNEIAVRGMFTRHLVLPGNTKDSKSIIDFLASVSKEMWISLMAQYHPLHKASLFKEINRKITKEEYWEVIGQAQKLDLDNYLIQELESSEEFIPDFKKTDPFD